MVISRNRAVILLSGGLDSATAAASAQADGFQLFGLSLGYGQVHHCEIEAAKKIAEFLRFEQHRIIHLPIDQWGGSSLFLEQGETRMTIPTNRSISEMTGEIPNTYVPARNTIFLSLALSWAEVLRAQAIYIGVNAVDYSGYPDCRPEFIEAFQNLAKLATKVGAKEGYYPMIQTPLLELSKKEIIEMGVRLGVNYSLTHSCYNPNDDGIACGVCDSCQLRLEGFKQAKIKDPIAYQNA